MQSAAGRETGGVFVSGAGRRGPFRDLG